MAGKGTRDERRERFAPKQWEREEGQQPENAEQQREDMVREAADPATESEHAKRQAVVAEAMANAPMPEEERMQRQAHVEETMQGMRASDDADGMRGTVDGMPTGERVGMVGRIGTEEVRKAEGILQKYKQGKATLEKRIVDNERWYKLRNWDTVHNSKNPGDPKPVSAWLFNSIVNKHADAMDNIPEPNVLPRERSDEATAKILGAVIPAILESCEFEAVYSGVWWYKLKTGTGVYGVFWDNAKENGLGDIDIRELDVLNLYWQPGITDIQKSANLFHVEMIDREALLDQWPEMKDKINGSNIDVTKYIHDDTVDETEKVAVVDWYYKRRSGSGRDVLHYVKFAGGQVLYASENDPAYADRGYYDHGKYPVVLDVLYPVADSPCGFGVVDVCRSPQMYIDKLDQAMLKNAVMQARARYFARQDGTVNETEFADLEKDFVHFNGSGNPADSIMQIQVPVMGNYAMAMRSAKIDELKETSGNRDFQQGGTASGVTAASAISALQEAGSKTSRDMIKSSYRALAQICYLCIDLMRQFYTEPRVMRVVGEDGRREYASIDAGMLGGRSQGAAYGVDMGEKVPVFDIRVSAQKQSPFATVAQNERAKELYGMGFFKPDLADQAIGALDMMQFDGIEKVRERIEQNGTLMQRMQQLGQIALAMAQQIDANTGSQFTAQIAQLLGANMQAVSGAPIGGGQGDMGVNALGDAFARSRQQTAAAARNDAASMSTPR